MLNVIARRTLTPMTRRKSSRESSGRLEYHVGFFFYNFLVFEEPAAHFPDEVSEKIRVVPQQAVKPLFGQAT